MLVKVEFAAFAVDPEKNTPLAFLRECSGARILPVPLGPLEAGAIALETLKVKAEKPLTIDVAKSILEQFDASLARVVFQHSASESLEARLEIVSREKTRFIICRPCDAIALALRCKSPMYVQEEIMRRSTGNGRVDDGEKLRSRVASLDTLEFGTFHLE
ncbi:MAG: bifunctional nuclease family protein [Chitinispirillaceae bacterium]|nr:bifunctional nuclease family protein [Chitinispirillaceae bacterium]